MTTNHRPTFESRRGRDLQPSSIVHSRALPAHKQLKYRNSKRSLEIDPVEAKDKINELKLELLQRERAHKGVQNDDLLTIENGEDQEVESYQEKRRRIQEQIGGLDDSDNDAESEKESDNNEQSEEEESSEEESDDEAELLKELEKIKKERAEAKRQQEIEDSKEQALTSNPLLNPNKPLKKSWRQDTVFKHQNNTEKKQSDDDYVNDLVRSDFHKKFLNRYIK